MSWKGTWTLLGCAALLFGFIYFFEQHRKGTADHGGPPPPLLTLKPQEVTAIQLRRTNQFVLRVERTNGNWGLVAPLAYPAQPFAIEALLKTLSNLRSETFISLEELSENKRSVAEYGLDVPRATITLQQGGQRNEILVGSKTPVGNQVYIQVLTLPGIHVVNDEFFEQLPRAPNDWRDPTLITFAGIDFDRIEVRSTGRGFALQFDPTNQTCFLTKPTPARASTPKVVDLVRKVTTARVTQFVSDDAREDLDALGLQPPQAELIFGLGTNDMATFQFGKSPTNDPSLVYARRADRPNVVLLAKSVVDALQIPYTELRDRRLLSFSPEAVDTVEVVTQGAPAFSVRKQFNGAWMIVDADATVADTGTMKECLERMAKLEGLLEKDVVTDFGSYGLEPVARRYFLKSTVTNATGQVTNRVLAQLDVGALRGETVFARGAEDTAVFTVPLREIAQLPYTAWQLRDRRVWSFTTNQVARVSVRDKGYVRQMMRNGSGSWVLAPGSEGVLISEAVEEALYQLGDLRAALWVARGDERKLDFGFKDDGRKITVELKNGDKPPQVLSVEFGGHAQSSGYPYAMAAVDGQNWIFEFPIRLHIELLRLLYNPTQRRGVADASAP
jgi:hypothetical protein